MVGRYPALSHAFLLREVAELRRLGLELETISIRPAREGELRTAADREARRTTFYVLPAGPLKLAGAHLAALGRSPSRYLATLAHALRLGPRGPRGWLWQLFYFAESMLVWRRCRELRISHLHSHFADTGTDSAMLAAHFERPHAAGAEGWSWSFSLHGPTEFAESARNRLAAKLRSARFVVCISEFARRGAEAELERSGGEAELHVIPLGIDVARFSPAPEARAAAGVPAVLCLGRLVPQKGQADLLAALSRLRGEGVEVTARLAGDGPERASLERTVARLGLGEEAEFLGGVSQDDVVALYREATIFCLPSLDEGLPVVLLEAMACETPVVTTRVAAIPELVSDGANGLLVEPGDSEALATALGSLLSDAALRDRLGAAGRRTVSEGRRLDRQAAQLAELFRTRLA
ncbi:MAG: colanic acid biosynthesis glycosyltransferase WcaL [Solirubrobacterales bacterium]|nr:colanic acid biosynthesis glycosyltransferase WcaL [Solirubrobacterales bacterium]